MKGVIYTLFQDMVEEQLGLECWEYLLENTELESGGVYTSGSNYPDEEIVALVTTLSEYSKLPAAELIESFGKYLLPHLIHSLPEKIRHYDNLWDFLASVDDVIHVEVHKIDPKAMTPEIKVLERSEGAMKISYKSPRKMCFLALGLIGQAGEHFNSSVEISHQQCMHDGCDSCILDVKLSDG